MVKSRNISPSDTMMRGYKGVVWDGEAGQPCGIPSTEFAPEEALSTHHRNTLDVAENHLSSSCDLTDLICWIHAASDNIISPDCTKSAVAGGGALCLHRIGGILFRASVPSGPGAPKRDSRATLRRKRTYNSLRLCDSSQRRAARDSLRLFLISNQYLRLH